ncbi:hypothetical protein P3531_23510 [Vibrio parahaemolyticus]|nr:hypothetical protein [Vibrio parahaemolyticus]MDG2608618.1 hypothetical protein [Vibrio parahaemolyticus]
MSEIKALRVVSPNICDCCMSGTSHYSNVMVTQVKSTQSSWNLNGIGELRGVTAECPFCAAMYEAVERIVPIHVKTLSCPKCKETDTLELTVGDINHTSLLSENGDLEFEFQAELRCTKCHERKSFSQKMWDMLSASEVEITLTGIRVKRA